MRHTWIILFLIPLVRPAAAQPLLWRHMQGPYGCPVGQVVTDGQVLLLNAGSNIYRSLDTGRTWQKVYHADSTFAVSAFVANSGAILGGLFGVGIFRSTDQGNSWVQRQDIPFLTAFTSTDSLFYASAGDTVYRSLDRGASWQYCAPIWKQGSSIQISNNIYRLAARDSLVFAGTDSAVYRSRDFGQSWQKVDSVSGRIHVMDFAMSGHTIFVCRYDGSVHRSTDDGISWTIIPAIQANHLFSKGNSVYAAAERLVYSSDNGEPWTPLEGIIDMAPVYQMLALGPSLFAATLAGVLQSIDSGLSWGPTNKGLPPPQFIRAFANLGTLIFAGTSSGVFQSADDGVSWNLASDGLTDCDVQSIIATGQSLFVATLRGGIFCSTDSGGHWLQKSNGISDPYLSAIASNGRVLIAAGDSIYRSTDNGENWSNTGVAAVGIYPVAVANGEDFFVRGSYILHSTDDGLTWQCVDSSGQGYDSRTTILMDGALGLATGPGLRRSLDSGRTWNQLSLSTGGFSLAKLGNTIFLSGSRGIFYSLDSGVSWIEADSGHAKPYGYLGVCNGGYIFDGTTNGIWRTDAPALNDVTASHQPEADEKICISPNPANSLVTVYSGATSRSDIAIYNMLGHRVDEKKSDNVETVFDISSLATGSYQVVERTDQGVRCAQLIVTH